MLASQACSNAACFFTLISSLQIQITLAVPLTTPTSVPLTLGADNSQETHNHVRRLRPPPEFRSVQGIRYTTLPTSTTFTDEAWPTTIPVVYEIPDGQIQATYPFTKNRPNAPSSIQAVRTSTSSTAENPTRTTVPTSSLTALITSAVQSVTAAPPRNTTGVAETSLETSGQPASQPFPTITAGSKGTLSLVDTSTLRSIGPTVTAKVTGLQVNDIFQPIATAAPPAQIPSRSDHPVPRLGIQPQQQKLETNKFYANFFLGDQTAGTWTHPYSLSWSKGAGETGSWGIAVSHVERDQLVVGPKTSVDAGDWAYFVNPIGIQSLVLSATELGNGTKLTTDTLEAFSVNVNLIADDSTMPTITFPLVQGMAFVTAVYTDATPLLQSGVGIQDVTYSGSLLNGRTFKWIARLDNGFTWLIYVTADNEGYPGNNFTLISPVAIEGASGFTGYIQVAKIPANTTDAERLYDGSAGVYANSVSIRGSVDGQTGTYSLSWTRHGPADRSLLMFALPHHVQSLSQATAAGMTEIQLMTTTKGLATAIRGNSWTLIEPDLPIEMSFDPWSPSQGSIDRLPPAVISAINTAGTIELAEDMAQQTNTGSMYYDGKALAKFAAIVYVVHRLGNNITLALTGLLELEKAFGLHVSNQQISSLVYDTCWGGAVDLNTYLNGNSGDDFGNTYYNDHHFHYGYFLYAAAVIGYLDPAWLKSGTNKAWVDMLARDFADSVSNDPYFPFSRMFDWYMGHSWAEGLFESADGKNQESSSEDTMASYGIKMWGQVTGDKNMEARGNLMLAIQARSLSNYFLYLDNNTVEPADFVGNRDSGILYENKIDHTTFFGNAVQYIQGISMIPLMPMSTLIRSRDFVSQEWAAYNFGGLVGSIQSGWRGILMANLAIIDPVSSYNFFSNSTGDFAMSMLDGGASQTWYLAWSAALGGSPY